jgi:acetolactate synthase-1/2/3 large subunit
VQSPSRLADNLARAIRKARRRLPGPVHLSVPQDVLEADCDATLTHVALEEPTQGPFPGELLKSNRPLVIAGPAMMRNPDVRELEEASGVPVVGMESPRGLNDPSLGKLVEVLSRADAVLLLGKKADFTLNFGKVFAEDCKVLRNDAVPQRPRKPAKSGWLGEVKAALAWRPPEWKQIDKSLHPAAVCRAVQKLLDAPGSVLVSDGGEFGQWAQACLSATHRVINGPAGSIGSALPFAAAAKLAHPKAPVVAMLGDGTFGFHMSEIDTAVRQGLDYVAVVGNDACWNAEYQIQLKSYGKDRAKGLDLLPTRYGAVAAAMGAHGEDVSTHKELDPALQRAARAKKPAVVNVMIERQPAPKY